MSSLYDAHGPGGSGKPIPPGTMLDCGHVLAIHDGIGAGYAGTGEHEIICYPCAEDREAQDFLTADVFTAYATTFRGDGSCHAKYCVPRRDCSCPLIITTWTGRRLADIVRYHDGGGHPYVTMRYLRVTAPDGSRWWGRYAPEWSEVVTLHRARNAS